MRVKPLVTAALVLIGSLCASTGLAAVLTVTDCRDTTPGGAPGQLRRLITDAAPGDTIDVPACVITLTGAPFEDANAGGDLDIAKNLTIQGAGARRTVIDGGGIDGVIDVLASTTVTLADVMIRNGAVVGGTEANPRAGGIRSHGTLTLTRVAVRDNRAANGIAGAGIFNAGTLTGTESSVEGNLGSGSLTAFGLPQPSGEGGIRNAGTLSLTRSSVVGNHTFGTGGGVGGIFNTGTATLVDSTVSGNTSNHRGFGGPGVFSSGSLTVVGGAFVGNSTGVSGSNGTITLTNTIVVDDCLPPAAFVSLGGNLATDADCPFASPGDAIVVDAGLGPLGPHGGQTLTHPLLPASPAIDTALPAACSATDQRGVARPGSCDKGPFEFTPPIFADVPATHFVRGAIEALSVNGVTGGCGVAPPVYCPDDAVTRGQSAVLLLRALEGPGFTPSPATGIFADVPASHPFAPWIEELFRRGITGGCGMAPPIFCPDDPVTRGQAAVLLLRALSVAGFVPPAAVGLFADVPAADPFAPWIEEFFRRGITSGCQPDPAGYCPADPTSRAQIAAFLVLGFGLGF